MPNRIYPKINDPDDKQGFKHYRGFFTEEEIREFEEAVVAIYKLQARKIDVYRS